MKIYSPQLKGTTTLASGSTASITGSFTGSIAGIDINLTNEFTSSTKNRLTTIENVTASYETKGSGIVSGSSQITISSTTGYTDFSGSVATSISASVAGATWANINGKPAGIVSGSSQVIEIISPLNTYTSSVKNAINVIGEGTSSVTTIYGNLVVEGTTITVSASNLAIADNMIYLNDGNTITDPDLGIAGNYNDGVYQHAGIFSDASDSHTWKVYKGYTPEPSQSIDITHGSFTLADFQAATLKGSIAATNGVVSGSSQVIGILSSLNTYTGSNDTKWSTLLNVTSSLIARTGSLATTGSNTFFANQIVSGNVVITGSLGIGTATPGYPLDLYGVSSGTTSTLLRLKNGYNDTSTGIRARWDFASIAGAYLDVTTDSGGSKSMTLYLSAANATPSQVLTIAGSNGNLSSNGSVFAASDLYTANALRFNGSGLNASDKKLYSPADGELQWMTHSSAGVHAFSVSHQGTRYVYLDVSGNSYLNGGNVGIGITNPSNKLQVSGNIYSTDTVFGRNLKPEAFAGPAAGSPTGASIPQGYSTMNISSLCDNQWRVLMTGIGDSKIFMWVTLGDAASKNTGYYTWQMTSPAYGVANFANIHYMSGGWNTGGFEFTYDASGGNYRLLVRTTSYYSAGNTAYGTIYFLRLE